MKWALKKMCIYMLYYVYIITDAKRKTETGYAENKPVMLKNKPVTPNSNKHVRLKANWNWKCYSEKQHCYAAEETYYLNSSETG